MRRDQLSPDGGRTTDIEGGYSLDPDAELADSGVTPGSYGLAGSVPAFTVDAKGRISAAANVPIAINQGQVANLTADMAAKAPLASPVLTGTPTAPTAGLGTNTTQVSTTAFVAAAIAALVASSPAALDTLNELATALGNDPNFATTMVNALAGKLNNSGGTITGSLAVTVSINTSGYDGTNITPYSGNWGGAGRWGITGTTGHNIWVGQTDGIGGKLTYPGDLVLNISGSFNATATYKVNGTQVLGAQQTGLGANLPSTHCGSTYTATEQSVINALIDKFVLLETKLKAHGLVAT